jgi:predicted acyl esterase
MTQLPDVVSRTEIRDGMKITWHQAIPMDDGLVLRADLFAPIAEGKYPVILTYGVYAKGLAYQDGYPHQWRKMVEDHPEILEGSTNKYQNWEVTDPERWIPHGYVVLRVDSRGAGWSPGLLDCNSPREIQDIYQCIEWAGTQPWSNGKVGMLGISYYASNQWRVAGLHPPHLTAIIPWEGQNDRYRDSGYHGGILSEFQKLWAKHQVANIQYGLGARARKNPNTGESVAGPLTLSDDELAKNRLDVYEELKQHPFDDAWHRERSADLSRVTIPLLTCANWGGQGIHPRGNFNGFTETASRQKWLEVHGDSHWALFSSGYGLALQKRFFDFFLKGIDNGWDRTPPVTLNVRHPDATFTLRHEQEWPLARTRWTKLYLDPTTLALRPTPVAAPGTVVYAAMGPGGDVLADARARDRDHGADRGQAIRVVVHAGRRSVPDRPGVRSPGQGADVHGVDRSQHAHRQRMAAGLASPGRPQEEQALATLSPARSRRAADARRDLRMRRRDPADLHRAAGGLAHCAHGARPGLRVRR